MLAGEIDAATNAYMAAAEESLARVIISEKRKQDTGLINSISARLQDLSHDVLQLHNSTSYDDLLPQQVLGGIPTLAAQLSPEVEGIWNTRPESVEPFPFFAPLASPAVVVPTFDYLASPRAAAPIVVSPRAGRRPMSPLPPPASAAAATPELLVLPPSVSTLVGAAPVQPPPVIDYGLQPLVSTLPHMLRQSVVPLSASIHELHEPVRMQNIENMTSTPTPLHIQQQLSVPIPTVIPKAAVNENSHLLGLREDSFPAAHSSGLTALAPANSLIQHHLMPASSNSDLKHQNLSVSVPHNPINDINNEEVAAMAQALQLHASIASTDTSLPPSVPLLHPSSDVTHALHKLAVVLGCTGNPSENDDIPQMSSPTPNSDMLEQLAKAIYSESRKADSAEKSSHVGISKSLN